jgi:hypothetical protein
MASPGCCWAMIHTCFGPPSPFDVEGAPISTWWSCAPRVVVAIGLQAARPSAARRGRVGEREAAVRVGRVDPEPPLVVVRGVDLVETAERVPPRALARVLDEELLGRADRPDRVEREPLAVRAFRRRPVRRDGEDDAMDAAPRALGCAVRPSGGRGSAELDSTPLEVGRYLHGRGAKRASSAVEGARNRYHVPCRPCLSSGP